LIFQAQGLPGLSGEEHLGEMVDDDLFAKALDTDTLHDPMSGDNVVEGIDFSDLFSSFAENPMNSPPVSPKGGDIRPLSPSVLKQNNVQIGAKV
jgi:hypothetical protein